MIWFNEDYGRNIPDDQKTKPLIGVIDTERVWKKWIRSLLS